ncbi:MAG: DUF2829 domain-containing protein [Gammaproteobacteria bacterium]|nr:MAG: DUF2829 domain-containing protein [Gammaproteobacteria bacterium]
MQPYIGTKLIDAKPMSRGEYNSYRGWEVPADENPDDDGYLVEYQDGGQPNHPDHMGYISWSPKDVFERNYSLVTGMTFGQALEAIKKGYKVARSNWNGKDMFLFLVPGSTFQVNRPPLLGIYDEGTTINYRPHIDMRTADGEIVPWVASQSDLLVDDWFIVG